MFLSHGCLYVSLSHYCLCLTAVSVTATVISVSLLSLTPNCYLCPTAVSVSLLSLSPQLLSLPHCCLCLTAVSVTPSCCLCLAVISVSRLSLPHGCLCHPQELPMDVLLYMPELRLLHMDDNWLTSLTSEFRSLEQLQELRLAGNPFRCDCHTLWMKDWLLAHQVSRCQAEEGRKDGWRKQERGGCAGGGAGGRQDN